MKKIFMFLVFGGLMASVANAQMTVYQDGTRKGVASAVDFISGPTVTRAGDTAAVDFSTFTTANIVVTGDITGDGGDQLVGFLNNTITSTTTTLTAAQCGSTIVNDSADVLTLPEASTVIGCRYTFMTNNASNFDINPADASDTITLLTNAAGDAIRNATVGNFVCLQAVDATNWSQCGILGTWSDIN